MVMANGEKIIVYLLGCVCLCFIIFLIDFLNRVWWTPIRVQSAMRSQGIKGPSYKFLHGTKKEIAKMRNESMSKPMELSHHMFPRIQPHLYAWNKLYGKNFLIWDGPQAQLIVTECDMIKEILYNKEGAYTKCMLQSFARKLLGDGLFSTRGEKWLKQRKLANHAFHGESLKAMFPAMVASVEKMLEGWRQKRGKEIEVFDEFKVFASEVISRTAFGSSYLEGEHIFDMLRNLALTIFRNAYTTKIPIIEKFAQTKDDIESDRLEQDIRDSILELIKKREEEAKMDKLAPYGTDYLGVLLKAYHTEEATKKISLDDLIDECKTFYVAGHETTTNSLTWTVLLLAIHTDWQDRARKEVIEIFGQQNPTSEGISRLKTVSMVINESLRLYPPVTSIARDVQKGHKLGKLLMPAKLVILIPPLALHNSPEIWGEDFHTFNPERFATGAAKATENEIAAFLPFGFGPRICVGINFASTEIKIALTMILQRYKFTLSPSYVHSPFLPFTMAPKHGVQIILQAV